jgi:hypothetical protein
MTISIATKKVTTAGPKVVFRLSDGGGAHVSITIFIPGVTPLPVQFVETFLGAKEFVFLVPAGTHTCSVQIAAFNVADALGPTYDSKVEINTLPAAAAKGSIAKGKDADVGFKTFSFTC